MGGKTKDVDQELKKEFERLGLTNDNNEEDSSTIEGGSSNDDVTENSSVSEKAVPAKEKSGSKQTKSHSNGSKTAKSKPKSKKKAKPKASKTPEAKKKEKPKVETKAKTKKAAKKSSGSRVVVGKQDMLKVDPRKIIIPDDWNPRVDYGDMKELKASIKQHGVKYPIIVRRNTRNQIELVDGFRRMRAVLELIKEGNKIVSVPALEERKGISDIEAMLSTLTSNTGKPLTPLEEAKAFSRLIGWGVTEQDLAEKTGKSLGTVKGRLLLIDASPKVIKALEKEEISLGAAKRIVRASKGDIEKQNELVSDQKSLAKKPGGKGEAARKLADEQKGAERKKVAPKRARELLFEVASLRSKLDRSRKAPGPNNSAYTKLERLERKLVSMKRRGMFRP